MSTSIAVGVACCLLSCQFLAVVTLLFAVVTLLFAVVVCFVVVVVCRCCLLLVLFAVGVACCRFFLSKLLRG